jgi:hypothetical protein
MSSNEQLAAGFATNTNSSVALKTLFQEFQK